MVDQKNPEHDAIEALYFAYRAFTAEPDRILAKQGLGRAHHRILYFVARTPAVTVGELLNTLEISKQALASPLRRLLSDAYITQTPDTQDKRVRRLQLTPKGRKLESALSTAQSAMLRRAFEHVGAQDRRAWLDTTRALSALAKP